ncbi:MAG: hypothetical protein AAFU85_25460 [Planctomycetota bacterium]
MKETILLALLFISLCGCSGPMSTEFAIPPSAVQTGLDAWMPVVLTDYVDEELPAVVTLDEAEVLLSDGTDRVGVQLDLTIVLEEIDAEAVLDKVATEIGSSSVPPPPFGLPPAKPPGSDAGSAASANGVQALKGKVIARTGLRYDAETQSFFCKDVEAESIVVDGLPGDVAPLIQRLCEKGLAQYFSENAVYTIDSEETAVGFATARLKSVTTRDGKLFVELGF